MGHPCDLEVDVAMLQALLAASDAEAARESTFKARAASTEALQIELWHARRGLIAGVAARERAALEVVRPFARVASLIDPATHSAVMLSLRTFSTRSGRATDFVQLTADHFHAAAALVRAA